MEAVILHAESCARQSGSRRVIHAESSAASRRTVPQRWCAATQRAAAKNGQESRAAEKGLAARAGREEVHLCLSRVQGRLARAVHAAHNPQLPRSPPLPDAPAPQATMPSYPVMKMHYDGARAAPPSTHSYLRLGHPARHHTMRRKASKGYVSTCRILSTVRRCARSIR